MRDTNESNSGTVTVRGTQGGIDGSIETLTDRWFAVQVVLE